MTSTRLIRICSRIVADDQRESRLFPRVLELANRQLPFVIVKLSKMTLAEVNRQIGKVSGFAIYPESSSRPLRGCIVCIKGTGLIFIERDDDENEQRFTLAHELVHFVAHYLEPRERAVARLGQTILEVLDGSRPPTTDERVGGVLSRCHIGPYRHILPDRYAGAVGALEDEADQIACEALAPLDEVAQTIRGLSSADTETKVDAIERRFGLPRFAAHDRLRQAGRLIAGPHQQFLNSINRAVRNPDQKPGGR